MIGWAWRWGPAVAQMVAIFLASSVPDLRELPAGVSDHTGHFVGYAILGGLLFRAVGRGRWADMTASSALVAWLASAAYGATDEFHQRFVHGRTPAFDDWTADAIGAAAAIAILLMVAAASRVRNRAV